MPTKEDLAYFRSLPLESKVALTKARIREWVTRFGVNGTYVSFSGGKDSTVLLHMARSLYPELEAVFVNTGLEYPEIQNFVRTFSNVTVLTPKMLFYEVIRRYGYPFISKNYSHNIAIARNNPDGNVMKNIFNPEKTGPYASYKWIALTDKEQTDFLISDVCCNVMKKNPVKKYEKETERYPILATLTEESVLRKTDWLHNGCNAFDLKRPVSKPMSFWTENDVLSYIKANDLEIASVYGDIVSESETEYEDCPYRTTGCTRTGCIFCGFGAHNAKDRRFVTLKETHPKQYAYCMNGGEYDIDGLWKPNKNGLGMAHVIDHLNNLYSKGGKAFINY